MFPLIYLKECTSTNDEILHFLSASESEFCAVYTFNQKKGKGQYGNSWQSPEGLNLAFTFAVRSEVIKLPSHLFNFHTAAAVADFLDRMTQQRCEIKWPNDLILKGKKIAGLLLEKKNVGGFSYFIVGIGINILQNDFKDLPKGGSLLTQTGVRFEPEDIARRLHSYLQGFILKEISGSEVLKNLNNHLFRKDVISVFEISDVRQNGIIKKVDAEGFLWVDLENDGLQKFYHKEIELLY
ncbi:biotin--[acetyl-CoA-carboxylase] ligase [Kaistella palustris]|uniref:biotin--[acetyl-CoA-carboxylase] ligase n=1 Tax=Kaistella palustris TaxID=493376 RepID=UPI000416E546|nr:biotin--[acetyl-CoA-carboxylase] ligase [Kaistella palustris]